MFAVLCGNLLHQSVQYIAGGPNVPCANHGLSRHELANQSVCHPPIVNAARSGHLPDHVLEGPGGLALTVTLSSTE